MVKLSYLALHLDNEFRVEIARFVFKYHNELYRETVDIYDFRFMTSVPCVVDVEKLCNITKFPKKMLNKLDPLFPYAERKFTSLLLTWIFVNKDIINLRLKLLKL